MNQHGSQIASHVPSLSRAHAQMDIVGECADGPVKRDRPEILRWFFMLRRWRGVRASVWMLWLGSIAVATAAFVALLLVHTGDSATGVPPALQVQRKGVPLTAFSSTTTSLALTTTVNSGVSPPTSSTTPPKVIVVAPRQPVSEGDATRSAAADGGSSGGASTATGSTVTDH